MVKEPLHAAPAGKRRRGTLTKKLFRDMRRSAMQFIAMMMLCFLGTWCFTGLDANWRMMDRSFETYFDQYNVADLWIKGSGFSDTDLRRVSHADGVEAVIARTTLSADCPQLGSDVSVNLHAFDGEMTINTPCIRSGSLLSAGDDRGILVEEQFAEAHRLAVGDTLTLRIYGTDIRFIVRGTVLSPEYIVTSKDVAPTPDTFGYVLCNRGAVSSLPVNEIIVQLADGQSETEIKEQLSRLLPEALILTVSTNSGTASARSFVSMFRAMSYIFPVLVYAIATMIVVSTLTRMIENQRIQMGTLKALGFPARTIRNHYLTYALVPSLVGSLIGVFSGEYTLPDVIWTMLSHNARMPWKLRAPISVYSWIATAVMVLLSLVVCLFVYRKAARECTADLLRPKPPKNGTRILLERWHGLWRRLSFNSKMVVRNIFRNKGRSFLSFVGVFTCNMLIVCSFCLQDSIPDFITAYYTRTHAYELRAELDTTQSGTLESYQARLPGGTVEGIMEKSISVTGPKQTRAASLTVIPEGQTLLCLGEGQTVMELPESGACVSKKLCTILGLSLGDNITIMLTGDDEPLVLPITACAETYIGQGVFLSKTAWQACRRGDFKVSALLLNHVTDSQLRKLEQMDEVTDLKYSANQNRQTLSIMDSTTTMFGILTGAALLLAFIICYNMGLMNFTERIRDYATLKVLGYHQREIRKLMMREQEIIALLATAMSVYAGILLTGQILSMCEYESMVFKPSYHPLTIVKASVISIVFAWFIERLLTTKVKKVDMVEALKSVE